MKSEQRPIDYAMLHGLKPLPDWAQKLPPEEQEMIKRELAVMNGHESNGAKMALRGALFILLVWGIMFVPVAIERRNTQKIEQRAKTVELKGQADSVRLKLVNRATESTR